MAKKNKGTNAIGDNGERYAAIRLTQDQVFEVIDLGEKVPAFDLICRINDKKKPYQFLVQVKATESSPIYTQSTPKKIRTPVKNDKYISLQQSPMPTYVAGVDNTTGDVYIAPAFKPSNEFASSIPTKYLLSTNNKANSLANLEKLKQDVIDYWDGLDIQMYKPTFNSALK